MKQLVSQLGHTTGTLEDKDLQLREAKKAIKKLEKEKAAAQLEIKRAAAALRAAEVLPPTPPRSLSNYIFAAFSLSSAANSIRCFRLPLRCCTHRR